MGKKRKELSHAEVWDDSALLQSWDDALEEYKLYHSIHARGERVEDVIKDLEDTGGENIVDGTFSRVNDTDVGANGALTENLEDGELEEEEAASAGAGHNEVRTENGQSAAALGPLNSHSHPEKVTREQQPSTSGMPNAIINGVQDETLKSLMMSWYYAGYYTGLHEGQQQAQKFASK